MQDKELFYFKYLSPLGEMIIASDGEFIIGIWFDGQRYFSNKILDKAKEKDLHVFQQTKNWLDIYFAGKVPDFTPPLSLDGLSNFGKKVLQILINLPYGQTSTYGKIAKQIERESGKKVSAQAVGGAVAHNPISIIIPCHRVIGGNGCYTGYAGGISKKIELLKLEGVDISKFYLPKN